MSECRATRALTQSERAPTLDTESMAHQIAHVVVALAEVYGWHREGNKLLARDNERVHIVNVAHFVRLIGWERASFLLSLRGPASYGKIGNRPFIDLPCA